MHWSELPDAAPVRGPELPDAAAVHGPELPDATAVHRRKLPAAAVRCQHLTAAGLLMLSARLFPRCRRRVSVVLPQWRERSAESLPLHARL